MSHLIPASDPSSNLPFSPAKIEKAKKNVHLSQQGFAIISDKVDATVSRSAFPPAEQAPTLLPKKDEEVTFLEQLKKHPAFVEVPSSFEECQRQHYPNHYCIFPTGDTFTLLTYDWNSGFSSSQEIKIAEGGFRLGKEQPPFASLNDLLNTLPLTIPLADAEIFAAHPIYNTNLDPTTAEKLSDKLLGLKSSACLFPDPNSSSGLRLMGVINGEFYNSPIGYNQETGNYLYVGATFTREQLFASLDNFSAIPQIQRYALTTQAGFEPDPPLDSFQHYPTGTYCLTPENDHFLFKIYHGSELLEKKVCIEGDHYLLIEGDQTSTFKTVAELLKSCEATYPRKEIRALEASGFYERTIASVEEAKVIANSPDLAAGNTVFIHRVDETPHSLVAWVIRAGNRCEPLPIAYEDNVYKVIDLKFNSMKELISFLESAGQPPVHFFPTQKTEAFVKKAARQQAIADQIYPHLYPSLEEMGYKEEKVREICRAFASDLVPMFDSPESFKGHDKRFRKNVSPHTIPICTETSAGYREMTVPFSYALAMDREGKNIRLQIIPPGQSRVLGKGTYGKVKKTPVLNLAVKRKGTLGPVTVVARAMKRAHKAEAPIAKKGLIQEMFDALPQANLVRTLKSRSFLSKKGEDRQEEELSLFDGDLNKMHFDSSRSLSCLIDTAETISALHKKGYIHRDLNTRNTLVKVDQAGRPKAFVGDFDFLTRMGSHEPVACVYYDLLAQAGFDTPSCDLYGLALMAGELILPGFGTAFDRTQLYTVDQQTNCFAEMVARKCRFGEKEKNQLAQAKNFDEVLKLALKMVADLEKSGKLTPEEKASLRQFKGDIRVMHEVFSLVVQVVKADKKWEERVQNSGLKRLLLKPHRTSKEEAQIIKEMGECGFPSAKEIAKRLKSIQTKQKIRKLLRF